MRLLRRSVQSALRETEARNEALQTASTAGSDLAAENASLSVRLKELESKLTSTGGEADVSSMLKEHEAEITRLRAQVEATDKTIEELCVEIERLGSSSNDAEKQFAHRVIDLGRLEDKVARLTQEVGVCDQSVFDSDS